MIELFNELATILIKIVGAGVVLVTAKTVVPWIRNDLIPWLREKRLYEVVQSFVFAAEKLGETGAIDKDEKKAWVIDALVDKGIEVTADVLALIECAVEELDLAIESSLIMIGDVFEDFFDGEDEEYEGNPDEEVVVTEDTPEEEAAAE